MFDPKKWFEDKASENARRKYANPRETLFEWVLDGHYKLTKSERMAVINMCRRDTSLSSVEQKYAERMASSKVVKMGCITVRI